jgi:cation diffusion facilitator family transporter
MGAYLLTGSATIMSDALESVVHVGATVMMFWCLRVASRMPDDDHPYGHGKVEYLSIGFEGGSILLAALGIVWEAVRDLWGGHAPDDLGLGFLLIAAAVIINTALGWHLIRVGRRSGSQILVADGHHVLSDVWTSIGVLVGVGVMWMLPGHPALIWLDSGIAVLLALILVLAGGKLMRQALRGLLDEADPVLLQQVVAAINAIRDPAWRDIHNLRLRRSGELLFVEFHLVVPTGWTIAQGHETSENLERHILQSLGLPGSVMIHLDHPELPGLDTRMVEQIAQEGFRVESATRFMRPE